LSGNLVPRIASSENLARRNRRRLQEILQDELKVIFSQPASPGLEQLRPLSLFPQHNGGNRKEMSFALHSTGVSQDDERLRLQN
jgi:hypothetical protein